MSPRRKAVLAWELFSITCTSAPSILEAAISSGMEDGVAGPAITSRAVRAGAAASVEATAGCAVTAGVAAVQPATVNAAVNTAVETTLFMDIGENLNIISCSTFVLSDYLLQGPQIL